MDFDTSSYLRRATGRAKSDVANKLVGMLVHEASRRTVATGMRVADVAYRDSVVSTFGSKCLYCGCELERNRVAVEHLEGMNRFRLGLHVPGNVAVACVLCNREKRRDDQLKNLVLADSGWESFLSHDSRRCPRGCKTCGYWASIWSDPQQRVARLAEAASKIKQFRKQYAGVLDIDPVIKAALKLEIERLYRERQEFAARHLSNIADLFAAKQ
jgi:hypothetical protein